MLCDSVGSRLRAQGMYCTTVQIQIKDPFLRTIQRQRKLDCATNSTKAIYDTALGILKSAWQVTAPIRLLNVTATGLTETAAEQMTLLEDTSGQRDKVAKLDSTVDAIRKRYGKAAIAYGSVVKTDIVRKDEESYKNTVAHNFEIINKPLDRGEAFRRISRTIEEIKKSL